MLEIVLMKLHIWLCHVKAIDCPCAVLTSNICKNCMTFLILTNLEWHDEKMCLKKKNTVCKYGV